MDILGVVVVILVDVLSVVVLGLSEHVLGLGQCSFDSSAQTRVFPEEDTDQ